MRLNYTLPNGFKYAPYLLELIEGNHVLIAGTVGAGKSVLENAIINSILCTKYPGQTADGNGAKLVLIDPKRVELRMYKDLPHTLYYADNLPDIERTLSNVRALIEARFIRMQREGIRTSTECPIYIFIDELVDLATNKQHGKEIMRLLADCASISRACRCFFICLTQSPARVIIPAQLKLLFNCRVALRCNNSIESRQIIDDDSATTLPRHGFAVVQNNLDRYKMKVDIIPDSQLTAIVTHWKKQHPIINALTRQKLK